MFLRERDMNKNVFLTNAILLTNSFFCQYMLSSLDFLYGIDNQCCLRLVAIWCPFINTLGKLRNLPLANISTCSLYLA